MRRVPALDGVRGLAILLVIIAHVTGFLGAGLVGVLVFFVLSGYLITSLLLDEHARHGAIDLRAFYVRRALRLLPALVVLLVLFLLTAYVPDLRVSLGTALRGFAIGILYVGDFTLGFQRGSVAEISHLWSLAVEEQFYLLWPVTLLALLRLPTPAVRLRRVRLALVGSLVLHYLVMAASFPAHWFFYALPTTWVPSLLTGAAIALIRSEAPDTAQRLARIAAHPATLTVALATLAAFSVPGAFWWIGTYLVGLPALSLSAGLVVLVAAAQEPGRVRAVLASRPLVTLGDLSYSLYLYNSFCILLIQRVIGEGWNQRLLGLAVAVVCAVLSRRVVERPALRLKSRLNRDRSRRR